MLLSFAQFEREVTAERIRDKIAASMPRGMWMGGRPPLGYAAKNWTLVIVEDEAALARSLYRRYLELDSARALLETLNQEGVQMPERLTGDGRVLPGRPFERTQLYTLLRNPIYAGLIPHRHERYPGQHERLIDAELWAAVQSRLDANQSGEQNGPRSKRVSPLAELLFAPDGEPLVATHATKGKLRYRYYVSKHMTGSLADRASEGAAMRIPAVELEALLIGALADQIADPFLLLEKAGQEGLLSSIRPNLQSKAKILSAELRSSRATGHAMLRTAIIRADIHPDRIELEVRSAELMQSVGLPAIQNARPLNISVAAQVKRGGRAGRFITCNGRDASGRSDPSILSAIARGRAWWDALCNDPKLSVRMLATRESLDPGYVGGILKLTFLDPKLVQAFAKGSAPASITLRQLTRDDVVAPSWSRQRVALGMIAA